MSEFYDDLEGTALEMLTEFGAAITLMKVGVNAGGGYNPNEGEAIKAESGTAETRYAVLSDNPGTRIGIQYGTTLQNGTLCQRTDKWLYMDANGSVPMLQDEVYINGLKYSTVDVQTIAPGGQTLLYLMVVRR